MSNSKPPLEPPLWLQKQYRTTHRIYFGFRSHCWPFPEATPAPSELYNGWAARDWSNRQSGQAKTVELKAIGGLTDTETIKGNNESNVFC